MPVERYLHSVLIGVRSHALGDADRGGSGDQIYPERLCHMKAAVDFLVAEVIAKAVVKAHQSDAGVVEFLTRLLELAHGRGESPFTGLFLRGFTGCRIARRGTAPRRNRRGAHVLNMLGE